MPTFFEAPAKLRAWFKRNADEDELILGLWKVATNKPSVTYAEALDEALCFGWIDGVRASLGDEAHSVRFTPRKIGSPWSAINVGHAKRLIREGRMTPRGKAAFDARVVPEGTTHAAARRAAKLSPAMEKRFRADKKAWAYFQACPPSYREPAIYWVVSAKKGDAGEAVCDAPGGLGGGKDGQAAYEEASIVAKEAVVLVVIANPIDRDDNSCAGTRNNGVHRAISMCEVELPEVVVFAIASREDSLRNLDSGERVAPETRRPVQEVVPGRERLGALLLVSLQEIVLQSHGDLNFVGRRHD